MNPGNTDHTRLAHIAPLALFGLAVLAAPAAAQDPQTFHACYVPEVGAVYMIKIAGLPEACLAETHVEVSWTDGELPAEGSITTAMLADAAVTSAKLAAGAVTDAQLAFDAATQSELDGVTAGLSEAGTLNEAENPVDWTKLKGVPEGFEDGVDNTGGAADDLACDGCVGTAELEDGSIAEADLAFTPPPGDITGVTAGDGLTGGGTVGVATLSVAFDGPGSQASVARSDHDHSVGSNLALGPFALSANTTGTFNLALGTSALTQNTSGRQNVAIGAGALGSTSGGLQNIAVGNRALNALGLETNNVALGHVALTDLESGGSNVALGAFGGFKLITGEDNVFLGYHAGFDLTSGSSNIYVGNPGVATESDVIRIGSDQTQAFVAGIHNQTSSSGINVLVNAAGKLGTTTSSARFKEDVEDVGDVTDRLMRLRPVRFHYVPEHDDGARLLQFGLIAEEVAAVFPELVVYGADGRPQTLRYHFLPILLLDALQRQEDEVADLRDAVAAQAAALDALRAEVAALRAKAEAGGAR